MKIAVIGSGKTGSKVVELINSKDLLGPFNRSNQVSLEKLKGAQVGIIFTPGESFIDLIPLLLDSAIPWVIGSTGVSMPSDLDRKLQDKKLTWIYASNFSMGVHLLRPIVKMLANLSEQYLPNSKIEMTESHHIHKKDAPSGTAKTLREWTGKDFEIESIRQGDIIGIHSLIVKTPFEQITLTHEAKDRKLFASGAIWTAEQLAQKNNKPGLYSLEEYLRQEGAAL